MIRDKHPQSGKTATLTIRGLDPHELTGKEFRIEDWAENVWDCKSGWMDQTGNPACLEYGLRSGLAGLPATNTIYGKVGCLGYLIHESELSL